MFQEIDHASSVGAHPVIVREGTAPLRNGRDTPADGSPKVPPQAQEYSEIVLKDLVFCVVAAFRRHPHLNNVLTHISGASWSRVEEALRVILDPRTGSRDLSPLARNIVDLMCADRGVTGRILKPYYRDLLTNVLGPRVAARLIANVTCLFLEYEVATRPIVTANLTSRSASASGGEPN